MQAPAWASQPTSHNPSNGLFTAPQLPYTGPPPPFQGPRYSGNSQYPDLSLHESNQQNTTSHSHPTHGHDYNPAYQYMSPAPIPSSSCARQSGGGGYPASYEQSQYDVDGMMASHEWPSQPGSNSRYAGNNFRYVWVDAELCYDTAAISQLNLGN
ncbi:hypothetical protein B0H19DRAFT_1272673 [Mycena capillaripes]|nr:hypothetical protein B0H19DRAFT_1272673 [Mycena capillaripes]